jgi:hypothetical protein
MSKIIYELKPLYCTMIAICGFRADHMIVLARTTGVILLVCVLIISYARMRYRGLLK